MKSLCQLNRISQWYKRLRHSKGFGVHSPYAFMLVREIIDCRCRYYGYDDIEAYIPQCKQGRTVRKDARLIIRMVGRISFGAFVAHVGKDGTSAIFSAVNVADSRLKVSDTPVDGVPNLVYIAKQSVEEEMLCNVVNQDGSCIIFRGLKSPGMNRLYHSLVAKCRYGVIFEDVDISIIVVNRKMSLVKYTMKI